MVYDNALTKALISIQHYTFLPMMLVARFGEGLALHGLQAAAPISWLYVKRQDPQPLAGPESSSGRVQHGRRLYLEICDCIACSMQAFTR